MAPRYRGIASLRAEFAEKGDAIRDRLAGFRDIGRGSDWVLFKELCFCLLAIQTKARVSDAAVRGLEADGLLRRGCPPAIARFLRHRVRFHNHKAGYIVRARERFFSDDGPTLRASLDGHASSAEARDWLVREVDGIGMKEASHLLRNIGRGEELAILDRHVLRNLLGHGVIGRMPVSLTPRRYLQIEGKMRRFATDVGVPLAALDLLFWSRETGEIFK